MKRRRCMQTKILGRTNRLLSYDTTRNAQETTPPTILRSRGNFFKELLPSNDRGIYRQIHRHARPTILLLHISFASGTCLPSCCLAME
jgi:hypothetical protein